MKKTRSILLVLSIFALMTVGCAKKAMESQGDATQSTPASQSSGATQTPSTNDPQAEKMAALNGFLNEHIYFEFDSAVLGPQAMALLQSKAEWLQSNLDINMLTIEGHCDERGTEAYNLALGSRRADAVKQYLVDLGLTGQNFQTQSYGEERPVDDGHNEEAWAKNRRAAFVLNQ